MNSQLYQDANSIIDHAIESSRPGNAVIRCLKEAPVSAERIIVISVGKAAWSMAEAAYSILGSQISRGLILTKYGHSQGPLPGFDIVEAGHPIPDENTFAGTRQAMAMVENLTPEDTVLFLLSGGGSALFELSELSVQELQDINAQLLRCGADIQQINSVRKRISQVKGGRFAEKCAPAKVIGIILSDVIGNRLDMIASGPFLPDTSTCEQALEVVENYDLQLSEKAARLLRMETPKSLGETECHVCGDIRQLCGAALEKCKELGYETIFLTDCLTCQAKEAGAFLASIARTHVGDGRKMAFVAGGETVVRLTGSGLGGRNQELALAAAPGISGLPNTAIFSIGSDGTDGPTDAAGGYVDGDTEEVLKALGIRIADVLQENDSYHALLRCGGLIRTGATGTNVNDLSVVLIG